MNYQVIYDRIIDRAKDRQISCYKEKHHVTPKCLGGTDSKNNLVELTAREHFICHLLLIGIHPENRKLQFAAWAMANQTQSRNQKRDYKVSARLYERLRKEHSNRLTERNTGHSHKQETKDSISQKNRGQKRSAEQKRQMALSRIGSKREPYKSKELRFIHTCEACNSPYSSADIRGRYCKECKKPRECKCGCGSTVKTVGKIFARGCQVRGKRYEEIYKTLNPQNGFKKGNKFGKLE